MGKKSGIKAGEAFVEVHANDDKLRQTLTSSERRLKSFGANISGISKKIAGVGAAALGAFIPAIKAAADAEKAAVGFEVLLGSAEKAKKVMADLNKFAASTPFELPELTDATRKLLAFGVAQADLIPTLKAVGDLSAGIDAPVAEIAEIYGKAKVQGRLFMEDINQLTGRGIPIIQELAKQFGVTEGEVRKLVEKGSVNFTHLETAFQNLTKEGGKFGGMMEKMSATTAGKWSTLMDTIGAAGRAVGGALLPVLKPLLDRVIALAEKAAKWAQENSELAQTIAMVAAALTAGGGALWAIGAATSAIGSLTGAVGLLVGNLPLLGAAIAAAGVAYFVRQILDAHNGMQDLNREVERLQRMQQKSNKGQDQRRQAVVDQAMEITDPQERAAFLKKALEMADKNATGARASAEGAQKTADRTKQAHDSASWLEQRMGSTTGVVSFAADGRPIFGEIAIGEPQVKQMQDMASVTAMNADRAEAHRDRLAEMLKATEREQKLPSIKAPGSAQGAWNLGIDKLSKTIEGVGTKLGLITPQMGVGEWLQTLVDASMEDPLDDRDSSRKVMDSVNTATMANTTEAQQAIAKAMGTMVWDQQIAEQKKTNDKLAAMDRKLAELNRGKLVVTEGRA